MKTDFKQMAEEESQSQLDHSGRAKIVIEVVAGIIPQQPIAKYSKAFVVTEAMWEDRNGEETMKVYGFAQEYMRTLWNPRSLNWVALNWTYL